MAQWVQASQVKGLLSGSGDQRALPAPRSSANEPTIPSSGNVSAAAVPQVPSEQRDDAAEPWYYGFIEKYVKAYMWLGIALSSLALLFYFIGGIGVAWNMGGLAIAGFLVLFILIGLPLYGMAILGVLFSTALFLLAADAARNLRAIRSNTTH
jgi:hypothetical protein